MVQIGLKKTFWLNQFTKSEHFCNSTTWKIVRLRWKRNYLKVSLIKKNSSFAEFNSWQERFEQRSTKIKIIQFFFWDLLMNQDRWTDEDFLRIKLTSKTATVSEGFEHSTNSINKWFVLVLFLICLSLYPNENFICFDLLGYLVFAMDRIFDEFSVFLSNCSSFFFFFGAKSNMSTPAAIHLIINSTCTIITFLCVQFAKSAFRLNHFSQHFNLILTFCFWAELYCLCSDNVYNCFVTDDVLLYTSAYSVRNIPVGLQKNRWSQIHVWIQCTFHFQFKYYIWGLQTNYQFECSPNRIGNKLLKSFDWNWIFFCKSNNQLIELKLFRNNFKLCVFYEW